MALGSRDIPEINLSGPAKNARDRFQNGLRRALLEFERDTVMQKVTRDSFACRVTCYDAAGNTQAREHLAQCVSNCDGPGAKATGILHEEMKKLNNSLTKATTNCISASKDLLTPGSKLDENQRKSIERTFNSCLTKAIESHIDSLNTMNSRVSEVVRKTLNQ